MPIQVFIVLIRPFRLLYENQNFTRRLRENVDVEEYRKEYTHLMEKLKTLNMEIRLCHNDAGSGNFIYNEKEGNILKVYTVEFSEETFV